MIDGRRSLQPSGHQEDLRLERAEGKLGNGSGRQDAARTCVPASTIVHDEVSRLISVPVCHLSRFAPPEIHTSDLPSPLRLQSSRSSGGNRGGLAATVSMEQTRACERGAVGSGSMFGCDMWKWTKLGKRMI